MTQNTKMYINAFISAVLGAFFLFSAITKMIPIETFEFVLKMQLGMSEQLAFVFSRFMVGLEAALGLLLLINIFGNYKWVIKFSFLLVIAFTIHLFILLFTIGNDINCGCMGNWFEMSPLASIFKNIFLLILLGYLWKNIPNKKNNTTNIIAIIITLVLIIFPFIYFKKAEAKVLKLDAIYTNNELPIPTVDIRKEKQLVAFLSLGCRYCKVAAKKLTAIKKEAPSLPIYVLFADIPNEVVKEEEYKTFISETGFEGISYSYIDAKILIDITGGSVPSIYWLENGKVIRKPGTSDLNSKELTNWINKR